MSTVHLPHSTYNGYTFACPNCAEAFSNHDDVITHLSVAVNCGQWVIQGAAHDANEDWNYQDEYGDDSEAVQDVYSGYEDFDPLDNDAEETIIGDLVFHHEDDIPLDDPALAFGNPSASPCLSADDPALASVDPSAGPHPGTVRQYHPNTPVVNPRGQNHLQKMDDDIYANIRNTKNIYYAFASKSEFDLAGWLSIGALSQKEVDSFLRLEHTKVNPPSFNTSKDLQARVEALPNVPRWYHQQIKVGSYKTKLPLMLYWRDGLEVVKYLFSNPVFAPCMDFQSYKEYKVIDGHSQQVYGEFMSADVAWEIQDKLPPGHSFVGIIGASDKTPLTIGTGNKEMHPVLISLANIHAGVHMKATSHAFALVAYLPIPKFLNVSKPVQSLHLNGVIEPFWGDWGVACPSYFLTPDGLHQWHKFYFDHPLNWVINIMGGEELDRRLSALQPHVGVCHWANGVSILKQCTGREHRDLEKRSPGVINSYFRPKACSIVTRPYTPYLKPFGSSITIKAVSLHAGGRCGKNGPLNHFDIPKLELAQHVIRSTHTMGAPYQWSSDITEWCHITHVKRPYRMSNHKDFHGQCCRFLDQQEKLQFFQLYTVLKSQRASLIYEMSREANMMTLHYPEATWISTVLPDERYISGSKPITSLFDKDRSHISSDDAIAILLTCRPHYPKLSIKEASQIFNIPDLCPMLGDLISCRSYLQRHGRRVSSSNCSLSFHHVHLWQNFRMQRHSIQDSRVVSPPQTIQALPPSPSMMFGSGNTVLISHESGELFSLTSSECYLVVQVKAILQPIAEDPHLNQPFLYVEYFNFSQSSVENIGDLRVVAPASVTDMFLVHRRLRLNQAPLGDIVPLDSVRQVIQLIPKFGAQILPTMDCNNSLHLAFTNSSSPPPPYYHP
ncbi:hypothetical protein C8R48DRAFT_781568 [Suillus tomentosus]|nr:hypothetical protein C8R48DRAFT_781568 [Suillus tomentosus]